MGRFSVELSVTNAQDIGRAADGTIPPSAVRRTTLRGLVDTGATRLVLPAAVALELGLPAGGETSVRFADGRTVPSAQFLGGDRNDKGMDFRRRGRVF